MKNLVQVFVLCGAIVLGIQGPTHAIDLSRGVFLDIPESKIEKQFGKQPPSQLTREDSLAIASYRFTGDSVRVVAILVEWSDRPGSYSKEDFDSLLFSRGFLPDGSVADYFYEVSYGQVSVTGEVFDWYNAGSWHPAFPLQPIFETLDPVIDYSQFDGDDNGDVDVAVLIRSGNGEEDSQDPNDMWSYAVIYEPGGGPGPFDGKHIPMWNTSPETRPLHDPLYPPGFSGADTLNKIRVFCHEMAHNLGLPDLYDYDDKLVTSTYYTPNDNNDHPVVDWCLMGYYGYGLLSIGSEIPSHLCGWSKKEMGWIDPIVLQAPGVFNIPIYSIETTKDSSLYLIPIDMEEGEYFLLECRNPYSSGQFDKVDSDFSCYFWPDLAYGGDPLDGGLLITHVHDSLGAYYWRINNGTPEYPHYTVAVEDAGYALGTAENPEGGLTDSAQWWYPYETRRAAPFNPDPSLYPMPQNEFAEYTNPSSDGYYGPTGIIVRVDSVGDDRLYAYIYNPLGASVAYTSPTQNELNVPVSTNISVTFDIDMDWATINDSTFVVNAWSTGLHQGTLAYEGATKTAAFDPSEDFAVGEIVTVVLTTDMKTASGFPLDGSYAWSFTTEVSDESTGTFSLPTNWEAGDRAISVFSADLDGDTDLDLAVANYNSYNVSILKNNGDGAFETRVDYTTGDSPVSVFCADLDGDTDLDLAVANANSDNVSILMNNGDGTFQTGVDYEAGYAPWYVFCADLDGDTHLDLAVINSLSKVSIFKNNGDGTFQTKVDYSTGSSPNSVFCADLDGDYDLDLVVPNSYIDSISILKNNGDGTFQARVDYAAGNGPLHVFCADLDGDTDLDLAVPNGYSDDVSILKNNGDGTFETNVDYITGDNPVSVFCADLDGDTHLDLALTNMGDDNVSILKNNGDGTFQAKVDYAAGEGPTSVFCADLDGDTDLDLAVANYNSDNVSILKNLTGPYFIRGDANGDGIINVGDIVYLVSYLYKSGPAPSPVEVGDCNCDGIVNVGDVVYLVSYLYKNGPPPGC